MEHGMKPLFKASEIGEMLGIKNIRDTINKFDTSLIKKLKQSVICNVGNTDGANLNTHSNMSRVKEQYFLTEDGLYELLFI